MSLVEPLAAIKADDAEKLSRSLIAFNITDSDALTSLLCAAITEVSIKMCHNDKLILFA
jgi:hypothetical protein